MPSWLACPSTPSWPGNREPRRKPPPGAPHEHFLENIALAEPPDHPSGRGPVYDDQPEICLRPKTAAANSGIILQPGVGYTNTRAGFGGFPLGFAAVLLFCLFSSRRLLAALSSIATVAAVILSVRLYGAAQDASFSQSAHILIPETVLLVVSLLGAVMETKRRQHNGATV